MAVGMLPHAALAPKPNLPAPRAWLDTKRDALASGAPRAAMTHGDPMSLPFDPFVVILNSGPLSPAEDLETAIIAAAQAQALGQTVLQIKRATEVIFEGEQLQSAIAKRLAEASQS
jgi:hypothetical protein